MGKIKRRLARTWAMAAIVAIAASTFAAPTSGAGESPSEVLNWNRIAVTTLLAFPLPAGGAPPASAINMAMTQAAVYDAVNAIERNHEAYLLDEPFDPGASKDAAVATAAYQMLTWIIATVPGGISFPNEAALQTAIDAAYAASLGAIPPSASKEDGIAAGEAAALAMIAARTGDGRFGPSQWVPNDDPGHWWPLYNPDGTPMLDPTPWVGGVDPFVVDSAAQFRSDGPLSLTSEQYAEEFNEVKDLGRLDSTIRTADQTHIALFWQSSPILGWNEVARTLTADQGMDVSESARLFAVLNLSGADSHITCWSDKYYWDFWRPWNAITRAGEDGNPATAPDASWRALITAPYPDHPSGHLCYDGAALEILKSYFGNNVDFEVTSVRFPGEKRPFDRFSDALKEIVDARIWAGLHFRTADMQARILGRQVAHYIEQHFLQSVDD